MISIKNITRAGVCALAALAATVSATPASATPLSSSFTISVWNGNNPAANSMHIGAITDPAEQALPTNPLITPSKLLATFTYKGAINFAEGASGSNNILNFLQSAGGSLSNFTAGTSAALNVALSSGNFFNTTIMEISGTTNHALDGTISHDDGISLFQGSTKLVDASAPTSLSTTSYGPISGSFNLWYVEANGLPANLVMDVAHVPEPASVALLGLGTIAMGALRSRRQKSKMTSLAG